MRKIVVYFLLLVALGVHGQASIIIDYRLYTTKALPYIIPSLPSGSEFYFSIKTGHPIYITLSGIDKGSGTYYKGNAPTRIINGDTVIVESPGAGSWLVTFKENNVAKSIGLTLNYQADLQDQTIGSATYGDYPDFIWVPQGGSAKVSAGPNMNPTSVTTKGAYKWKEITSSSYTGGYTDSLRTFSLGSYISRTNDGSGLTEGYTNDTISILEKPTFNPTAKTLNFPTTVSGISYKLLKVSTVSGNDTTWTEAHNVVGDGNARTLNLTDGTYKLTVTRGIYIATYPYGYFRPGITTAVENAATDAFSYRTAGNSLQFSTEVRVEFYSLQGQIISRAQGSAFTLPQGAYLFKAMDGGGNVVRGKIVING